jgi:hypothetical protein
MTSRRKAECRAERDRGLERETGLEPATFSLEGLDLYAVWLPSWKGVHFVSSYRVVPRRFLGFRRRSAPPAPPVAAPSLAGAVLVAREDTGLVAHEDSAGQSQDA